MNVSCAAFERWLDEGRPDAGASGALAHAGTCPRCAKLLELEEALAGPAAVRAPAGFTDAVLARIHAEPARAARSSQVPGRLQALLGPAVAIAVTAIPLLLLQRPLLARLAATFVGGWGGIAWPHAPSLAALAAGAWQPVAALAAQPVLLGGIGLGLAPALLLGAWQLFRWSEHWVEAVGVRNVPRLAGATATR